MVAPPRIGTRIVPDRPLERGDSVTSVAATRTKKATFMVWHQQKHRMEEGLNGVPRYETCPQGKALISTERRAEAIRMVPSSSPHLATDGVPAEVSRVTKAATDRVPDMKDMWQVAQECGAQVVGRLKFPQASGGMVNLRANPRSMTVSGIDERGDTQALGCTRLWQLMTLRRDQSTSTSRNTGGRNLRPPSLRIARCTPPSGTDIVARISEGHG